MTISDKIRIYELSRDLNLENKDILDAAQKLSITVKSHSSSISAEDAKKIKNLINKKTTSDKKILSINKSTIEKDNYKQKEDKSTVDSTLKGKSPKDTPNKKPLLIKPLNKPESLKIISNRTKNPIKPNILGRSQSNPTNKNTKIKPPQNFNQSKLTPRDNTTTPFKNPAKPPIQLIAKPKNNNNNIKSNESSNNTYDSGEKRQKTNKPIQNTNRPKTKNFNSRVNPPELVGAPIRRDDLNKQNISSKTGSPNRLGAQ